MINFVAKMEMIALIHADLAKHIPHKICSSLSKMTWRIVLYFCNKLVLFSLIFFLCMSLPGFKWKYPWSQKRSLFS